MLGGVENFNSNNLFKTRAGYSIQIDNSAASAIVNMFTIMKISTFKTYRESFDDLIGDTHPKMNTLIHEHLKAHVFAMSLGEERALTSLVLFVKLGGVSLMFLGIEFIARLFGNDTVGWISHVCFLSLLVVSCIFLVFFLLYVNRIVIAARKLRVTIDKDSAIRTAFEIIIAATADPLFKDTLRALAHTNKMQ